MAGADVDLVLDRDGLWTTRRGDGEGAMRSLPVAGGMVRRRVWRVPFDARLGLRVADIVDPGSGDGRRQTLRAAAIGRLVAAALRATDDAAVPVRIADRWGWRATPGPAAAAALDRAAAACLAVGAVSDEDPPARLRAFVDEVADARASTGADRGGFGELPARTIGRWADHVAARMAANARLVLSLAPPDSGEDRWRLVPYAVALDEPTTRSPLTTADPALFGATGTIWGRWREAESVALQRVWGRPLNETMATVATGRSAVLDPLDVLTFLDDLADSLRAAGFDIVAPGGLLAAAPVRRRLAAGGGGSGTLSVPGLGLSAEILIDGQPLTESEFTALAAAKSELVAVRGRWLRIGPADARRLRALAVRLRRPVTAAALLHDEAFEGIELDAGQVLPQGLRPARTVAPPAELRATLRGYQRAGLEWMTWLADNGLGGILADDMGLGKTLQVLAWIGSDRPGPTLVVCPMTLVDTWARQAADFAPHLRVAAFHGSARGCAADLASRADVVVTTYGLLARDPTLAEIDWYRVVLDEAQAIKNPDTIAARAARALRARHRLAVTGTPVENHIGDLWSLLAFASPGLLPRRKPFLARFDGDDPDAARLLRAVVGPFLLRRTKTDPGILPELPDREVIRVDCTLSKEQVGAYEAVVADMMGALAELRAAAAGAHTGSTADPDRPAEMGRRAAVLSGIARLKQICVHPALITESRRRLGDRSGKISRLVDLCAQIVDEGQAVVVFTQFASFVPDLAQHLERELGVAVATLTGGDSREARAATVREFSDPSGPPVLIASLKAGGTGLTLVRANHVVHLDRWWNPAVEDQASDRVWRIGQHQKVSVHVLVCPGTLEDRIDAALAAKRQLAAAVVRSTESAVTELSDDDLADLVGLVRDRVLG